MAGNVVKEAFAKVKEMIYKETDSYRKYSKEPIKEKTILLEGGQGKNINGNMFAFLRELNEKQEWSEFDVILVVNPDTEKAAKARLDFYGYQAKLVYRDTKEYCRELATAKYLLTDNSFPPYFHKREGQIYLNTWHGTPLKTLGKSDIRNAKSLANIQKNYLMSDYALFPNAFTRDVFMNDYMLANLYHGKVLLADYPRNGALLDKERAEKLRKKLSLQNKQLIAYMPTWRGSDRTADARAQKRILDGYFQEIDSRLSENQIFYVNLHFLLGNTMDFSKYQHIKAFPAEYETYDFLAICDMLVTDYSSVFFDFAVTGRKVLLFPYDLEDYMRDRGTYFPIEELPFPISFTVDDLVASINSDEPIAGMEEFWNRYCRYRDVCATHNVMELLVRGKEEHLCLEDAPSNGKELVLVYGGDLSNTRVTQLLKEYLIQIRDEGKYNVCLAFDGNMETKKVEYLITLPEDIPYLAMVTRIQMPFFKKVRAALTLRRKWLSDLFDSGLQGIYAKECQRIFYGLKPAKAVCFTNESLTCFYKIVGAFDAETEGHTHHISVAGREDASRKYHTMQSYLRKYYDVMIDHTGDDVRYLWEDKLELFYNRHFKLRNKFIRFKNTADTSEAYVLGVCDSKIPFDVERLKVFVQIREYDAHARKIIKLSKDKTLISYKVIVPRDEIPKLGTHNNVFLSQVFEDGSGFKVPVSFKKRKPNLRALRKGPQHYYTETDTVGYFRWAKGNHLNFDIRPCNLATSRANRFKIVAAFALSKIIRKKIIFLFEKKGSRYEESASVLYEELIDAGYKNAYFLIDRNYEHIDEIPEKYRKNLLYKGTFKHFLYLFMANTFLGTEMLIHAFDLQADNGFVNRKFKENRLNYAFLQHGVMYMVSLNSESRKFFGPKKTGAKYRVITSSQEEARHFIELGEYPPESVYVCGLPKYDRNLWNPGADKIVIMPTWRAWESNEARNDFKETKYYKMIERMFAAIPEKYRDKVIVLPHPLFYEIVRNSEFDLKPYMNCHDKYDTILRDTKVLITDYSSIAYDAYYRGANVIFYWEEKDECMERYGESARLMLNEENVYGDTCYCQEDLARVFEKNYLNGQNEQHQARYNKIVEFHDGKNTKRLIKMLRKDKII